MCRETGREGARRGFTLVELLVVIAIISTLAGLAIPAAQYALRRGRIVKCQHHLKQIGEMLVAQSQEPGGYPHLEGGTGAETLAVLYERGVIGEAELFSCPGAGDACEDLETIRRNASYAFAVGYRRLPLGARSVPIACDDGTDHHDGSLNVLYSDSHVDLEERSELPEGLED